MTVALAGLALLLGCDDGGSAATEVDAGVKFDAETPADAGGGDAEDAEAPVGSECLDDDACAADEYCDVAADGTGSLTCRSGCRTAPDSCTAVDGSAVCDPDTRGCVARPCEDDSVCPGGEYCDTAAGACAPGCRTEPDSCGGEADCDPESRSCVAVGVCCAANDACALTREAACDGDFFGEIRSCQPDPCTAECASDDACDLRDWCTPRGRCERGCRPGVQGTCPDGEVCDPATRACGPGACGADADCEDWQYCGGDGRCAAGCRTEPDNCEVPTRCDGANRCRVFCDDDAQCGEDERCDPRTESCRPTCDPATHDGCEADEACDEETLRCVLGCRDDAGELDGGDDEPGRATVLRRADGPTWSIPGRAACAGDTDYYGIALSPGERVEVELSTDAAPGTLTLRLLQPDGTPAAEDASAEAQRRIRFPAPGAARVEQGTWRIAVIPAPGSPAAQYDLEVRVSTAIPPCFSDDRDPMDDRVAGATNTGQRQREDFEESFRGDLCGADVDWWCFPMTTDDGLEVTLVAPESCGPLTGELFEQGEADGEAFYRTGAAEVADAGDGPVEIYRFDGDPESGRFSDSNWCLRVSSADEAAFCEGYDLTLGFRRRGAICGDDVEPNDRLDQSVELDGDGPIADIEGNLPVDADLVVPRALRICRGDVDLFRMQVVPGDVLSAWILGDDETGALEVGFLDAEGRARGSTAEVSRGDDPPSKAVTFAAGRETVHVRVSGVGAGEGSYQIVVRREVGDASCARDIAEQDDRNDASDVATLLEADGDGRPVLQNAAICTEQGAARDDDWYRFEVPDDGTRLCLEAAFRQREGNVELELFRAAEVGDMCESDDSCVAAGSGRCVLGRCQPIVAQATSRDDGEFIALPPSEVEAGSYFLRAFAGADETVSYDLTVTQVPPPADEDAVCDPDWRERARPNDNAEIASDLGAGRISVCDAWLCHEERGPGDWYRVHVPAGADRTVHVGFSPMDGSLLLTGIDPEQGVDGIAESAELGTSVQCLNIQGGPAPTDVFVNVAADAVAMDGDRRVDYVLQVSPTDLQRTPRGACDTLSGGLFVHIAWPLLLLE
ncbi:MAG: PPC domain-containing protein [Planctomycetota bacterium]|jgi:hypothetical protein